MSDDYGKYRRQYQDISGDLDVAAATSAAQTLVTVRNSVYQINVQRIKVSVITYAAKTWTFEDSTGTPVVIGQISIPATEPTVPGEQTYSIDFGPIGTALSVGMNFVLALSAAGAAARVHWEGYQRLAPGQTVAISNSAASQ